MSSNRGSIRFFLICIVFLDLIGFSVIFPIIPDLMEFYLSGIEKSGGLGASWISAHHNAAVIVLGGVTSSLWAFLQFISAPIWGRISDRIGRKKVLILTAAGLSASYLLWCFASTIHLFILHRIIGGIMAGNIGVAYAAMADITPVKDRTREMGLMGAAAGIGMIIGPVLGGLLSGAAIQRMMIQIPFLHPFSASAAASSILFALNAVLILRYPDTVQEKAEHDSGKIPLLQLKPDRHLPGFLRLAFINFLFALSFAGIELMFPYFLNLRFGATPEVLGFFFLYLGIIMAVGQTVLIRLFLARFSEKKILIIGIALVPLPLLLTANAAGSIAQSVLFIFPLALGAALVGPSLTGLVSHCAPKGQQGYTMGLFNSYGSLAYVFGPILSAGVYGGIGVGVASALITALLTSALFIALGIKEKTENQA